MAFSSISENPPAALEHDSARLLVQDGVRRGCAEKQNADRRSISGLRGAA